MISKIYKQDRRLVQMGRGKYKKYPIENNYIQDCLIDIDKKFIGEYRENGILRGYVICRKYHETAKSMSSVQFCLDYLKPRMFLGNYSCIKEIEFAKGKIKELYPLDDI